MRLCSPNGAFDPTRNQYHSTRILEHLARTAADEDSRVLGITGRRSVRAGADVRFR